jgi:DNA-binding NtrC family response regulator
VLCSAGYNALTTTSVDDAQILLKATKAKLAVISSRIQSIRGKPIQQALKEVSPDVRFLILEENFHTQDPGDAAEKLLNDINSLLAPAN